MCRPAPPPHNLYKFSEQIYSTPKVIAMSFIPCTQNCKFQDEGLCTLAQTQVMGQAVPNDTCLNFTPRLSNQHSNSLTNVANPDQI